MSASMTSLFCRHNRFTAECPICSKGTVLDPERAGARRRPSGGTARRSSSAGRGGTAAGGARFKGPFAASPRYQDEEGPPFEVRLERVPGGVRLGAWAAGELQRRAAVLPARDLAGMVREAGERELLATRDIDALSAALAAEPGSEDDGELFGASRGRAGDLRDELRVELVDDDRVRVARWILRPGAGWELQDSPVMLPAKRYAEAIAAAARRGLLRGADSGASPS
jgi:hypothetical protein